MVHSVYIFCAEVIIYDVIDVSSCTVKKADFFCFYTLNRPVRQNEEFGRP